MTIDRAFEAGPVAPALQISRSAVYVCALALVAAYFLVFPIWRAQFPLEIWLTEGFNAYWQDAAITGTLYPPSESLIGNNYPPLSFYAVAALGSFLGDNLYVGRALSLLGLLCIGAEVFLCCRILTGKAIGAAVGALWYVAIMAHNSAAYVGANDPQIAGQAIMGAGLVWFLARDKAGGSATPALLLMVVGGFWKHNTVGIPLTAIAWLLIQRGRNGIFPALLSVNAALSGLAICGLAFGHDFFANLLMPRAYRFGGVLANVGHLQWCAPAFAIWATWAIGNRATKDAHFTALHISIALAACLIQWTGDGVSGNAEFDLLIALGIALGVAFARIETSPLARYARVNHLRDATIAILLIRLLASDRQESALVLFSSEFRTYYLAATQAVLTETAKIAAIPGDVFCSNKLVCRLAGKRFAVDDFKTEQMVATGQKSANEVAALIAGNKITVVKNSAATSPDPNRSLLHAL